LGKATVIPEQTEAACVAAVPRNRATATAQQALTTFHDGFAEIGLQVTNKSDLRYCPRSTGVAFMTSPNDIQAQLAEIWARHLGVKQVAGDDNFFALGGHSLLGVKMIGAVQEKLNLGDELKPADLFEYPTLAAFCAHVHSLAAPSEEFGDI
jgi:acyl carrier protein